MDQLQLEQTAEVLAMRIAVTALFKAHPAPELLRSALRETLKRPGANDGNMPPALQVLVDRSLSHLDTLLAARTSR